MRLMFGKKKEENWEYIGTEGYFQKENYGQVADDESRYKEYSSNDYILEMFKPYLKRNEKVVCVVGSGKGDKEDPLKSDKAMKVRYKAYILRIAILVLFIIGVILCAALARPDIIAGFTVSVLFCSMPLVVIGFIIFLLIYSAKSRDEVNYAITDQRVLFIQYKNLQQFSLKTITDTIVYQNSDNTGKIVIKACRDLGMPTNYRYVIPKVNDPYRVKAIIDDAVAKYKSNLSQG